MEEAASEGGFSCEGVDELLKLANHGVVVGGVVARHAQKLGSSRRHKYMCIPSVTRTYLVLNPELAEDTREFDRKVEAGMGVGDLDKVKQEGEGLAVLLEVNSEGSVGTVIRRCPAVVRKVKRTGVLLSAVSE